MTKQFKAAEAEAVRRQQETQRPQAQEKPAQPAPQPALQSHFPPPTPEKSREVIKNLIRQGY